MNEIHLSAIDLNLLVVLDAVLQERSATRAAARLHVTQSAVSSALRRLRALFDDPLMIRSAHGFVPTARASELAPSLRAVLSDAQKLLRREQRDPANSARVFTIACTDAVGVIVLPPLLRALSRRMPLARLRMVTLEREIASDGLARGEVDLMIGIPPAMPRGCEGEFVYDDPMVCVVRKGHPSVRKRLTLDQYASLPHIEVALFGEPDDRVDRALARRGRTRSIALAVPHFSNVPFALAGSDCVGALLQRLAEVYARPLGLRILRPPIELPKLTVQQYWHRRAGHDSGLKQLRALIIEIMR